MKTLNPHNAGNAGAATAEGHNLRTYTSVTQLGLTAGAVTTAQVYAAMPNGSACYLTEDSVSDAPTNALSIQIIKNSAWNGFAKAVRWNNNHTEYEMYIDSIKGGLSGKWEKQRIESGDGYISYRTVR